MTAIDKAACKRQDDLIAARREALESGGIKLDTGKPRFDLLPPDAMEEVAKVYTFGAEKYAPRNWEKGMDWGRVYAAQQRHMQAMWRGESHDPETGFLHSAHATFGTLTLTAYQLRKVGHDTRFIIAPNRLVERPTIKGKVNASGSVTLSKADFAILMNAAGYEG